MPLAAFRPLMARWAILWFMRAMMRSPSLPKILVGRPKARIRMLLTTLIACELASNLTPLRSAER